MLKRLFRWTVLSDFYAAGIAAGIAIITQATLHLSLDVFSIWAVFFTALAVYALNRQDDRDIDSINVPERTRFVQNRGWMVLVFAIAGFFSSLTYALMINIEIFALMAFIFILGLFYSFPLLRPLEGWLGFERLKEPLLIKNILISGMYGAFVLIPILYAGISIHQPIVYLLFAFIFIRFFIVSTVFDLRDVQGDSRKHINTIPAVYGKEKTFLLLHGLNMLTLGIAIIGAGYHTVSALFGSMVLVTFLYSIYYLYECERENADLRHLCGVVVEADFVPAIAIAIPFVLSVFI